MHKFTDTVKKHKHKFEDKYEYLSIAEAMINLRYDAGDKRFFCYADIDEEKVYGEFTTDDFELAVNQFINHNYDSLISPLLKVRDESGNKTYVPATAMAEVKKRLMAYKR
jgi:hypothetical protein